MPCLTETVNTHTTNLQFRYGRVSSRTRMIETSLFQEDIQEFSDKTFGPGLNFNNKTEVKYLVISLHVNTEKAKYIFVNFQSNLQLKVKFKIYFVKKNAFMSSHIADCLLKKKNKKKRKTQTKPQKPNPKNQTKKDKETIIKRNKTERSNAEQILILSGTPKQIWPTKSLVEP